MVHLAQVKKDNDNDSSTRLASVHLDPVGDGDGASLEDASNCPSVYGSRFAVQQLPQTGMPETEMPKEVAYRMIKDELSLDGNPMLK